MTRRERSVLICAAVTLGLFGTLFAFVIASVLR